VINVASVMATAVSRYMSPYASSKAGLVQLTRTLALEWMRHNIQVNALCPGYFLTPMNEEFFATDTGKRLIAGLPSRRLGQPSELEGAAVFLPPAPPASSPARRVRRWRAFVLIHTRRNPLTLRNASPILD
jgi:NAD(P)-dependent dehydrogenase (short-subunit alcohol dehydrogenase family)